MTTMPHADAPKASLAALLLAALLLAACSGASTGEAGAATGNPAAVPTVWSEAAAPADVPVRATHIRIAFVPTADEFADDAREYERLWAEEGERIVEAMERIAGVSFVKPAYADTAITANIMEAGSNSGWQERPMRLRASYPYDTKRATLVHELGHRLQGGEVPPDAPEHPTLFLWVYDVWVDLWGQEFADEQVAVEKRRGERYVRAWDSALALSREGRAARWRELLAEGPDGGT